MPFEPGLADTNVPIYALDAEAPHHTAARTLLEAARDGSTTLCATPQILSEFYAVVTNARRVAKPR
jgi:predicted nucleic acid-binding protein